MNVYEERSRSIWMDVPLPQEPRLANNLNVRELVIGAGIAGLSTAYELAQQGIEVAVVDRGVIGGGMTARTTAHLSYETDDYYHELMALHGEDKARHYFQSQKAAVARIEDIAAREQIACDFARLDLFVFAPDLHGRRILEKEHEAAQRVGFFGVDWSDAPVSGRTEGCLRFPRQARFHPLKYLAGLAGALKRMGCAMYADTAIVSVEEKDGRITAHTASGYMITAHQVVLATNTPFVDPIAIHTKQAPYRTYVIAAPFLGGSVPDALIWDTLDPYHYVRVVQQNGEHMLIIGGEDHKTGTADNGAERLKRLQRWTHERFPQVGDARFGWSGQRYEPVDYVQFIGKNPGHENIYLVSGDSGSGLTAGVAASLILPDLMQGRACAWADVYDPSRKAAHPTSLGSFLKENLGAAAHLLENALPLPTAAPKLRDSGAVISEHGHKVAVYRDKDDMLHRMSACCTHMGCVVHWNSVECCWDCPCHGSQFGATGDVLQGPAVKPLAEIDEAAEQGEPLPESVEHPAMHTQRGGAVPPR